MAVHSMGKTAGFIGTRREVLGQDMITFPERMVIHLPILL